MKNIKVWEVKYITWGMDSAGARYFYEKENAKKCCDEMRERGYRVDNPHRTSISMDYICFRCPNIIEDANEEIENIIADHYRKSFDAFNR